MEDQEQNQLKEEDEESSFKKTNHSKHFGQNTNALKNFLNTSTSFKLNKFLKFDVANKDSKYQYKLNYNYNKNFKFNLKYNEKLNCNLSLKQNGLSLNMSMNNLMKGNLTFGYQKNFHPFKINLTNQMKLEQIMTHNFDIKLKYSLQVNAFFNDIILKSRNFGIPELKVCSKLQVPFLKSQIFTQFQASYQSNDLSKIITKPSIQLQNDLFIFNFQKNKNPRIQLSKQFKPYLLGVSLEKNKKSFEYQLLFKRKLSNKNDLSISFSSKRVALFWKKQIKSYLTFNVSLYNQYTTNFFNKKSYPINFNINLYG